MQCLPEGIQAIFDVVNSSAYSFWYEAISMPLLRKEISSKVGYEKTYLYSYRWAFLLFYLVKTDNKAKLTNI